MPPHCSFHPSSRRGFLCPRGQLVVLEIFSQFLELDIPAREGVMGIPLHMLLRWYPDVS